VIYTLFGLKLSGFAGQLFFIAGTGLFHDTGVLSEKVQFVQGMYKI